MMAMKDDNIINWLGFSLSPHLNMDSNTASHPQNHHYFSHQSEAPPTSSANLLSLSSYHLNNNCYGVGENGDFLSPFSVLPLKSYGTSHSQGEFPCPKIWIDHDHRALEQKVDDNTSRVEDKGVIMGCGELQPLSLSMSPASQSSCITAHISPTKKRGHEKMAPKKIVHRKSIDTFGQRTSQYRGVTRHRWTGRYEAHLWDNSCKKEGQTRKGRQVYLGGYDKEEKAARAYDLAALKYWGPSTHINFPLENYHQQLEEMKNMSRQEYVAHLRRRSSGFSRGASIYRGVTRHHQHGRWQARIGRVAGNKDLYLGTFSSQEEAAEAYDIAAIKFRGVNAVTNFNVSRYDVEKIMASNALPTGEVARRRNNETEPNAETAQESHDWKMLMHNQGPQHQENVTMNNSGNLYENTASFSVAMHDLISIASSQTMVVDESTSMPVGHSNPSSLVTSLSSSREASPDERNGDPILLETKFMISPSSNVNSWISAATHLPVFASWNDISPLV